MEMFSPSVRVSAQSRPPILRGKNAMPLFTAARPVRRCIVNVRRSGDRMRRGAIERPSYAV